MYRQLKFNSFSYFSEIAAVEKLVSEQHNKRIRKKSKKKTLKSPLEYLIVIDFEATCFEKPYNQRNKQEIIEFPAVLVSLKTGKIEKEFHTYCRPVELPELSDYCKNLTGITQETVDKGDLLADVIEEFRVWMKGRESIRFKLIVYKKF